MNVIVCVKQVPATNEVRINPETNTIVREGAESTINAFDTYAVEEGVRLREKYGGKTTVLSMGIPSAADMLRETLAVGADDAVLLTDRAFAGSDTLATAYALSMGIKALGGCDLVICGKQASDGDTAQVGPSLAEKLGVAHATYARKILSVEPNADGGGMTLTCQRMTDDGYETLSMPLPAVITVVKEINEPRLPSIKGMMRAKKASIKSMSAADIGADADKCGLAGSPTQVVKTFVPQHDVKAEMLGGEVADQAAALISRIKKLTTGGDAK